MSIETPDGSIQDFLQKIGNFALEQAQLVPEDDEHNDFTISALRMQVFESVYALKCCEGAIATISDWVQLYAEGKKEAKDVLEAISSTISVFESVITQFQRATETVLFGENGPP